MKDLLRPLVLVHGLWDRPELFNKLITRLDQPHNKILLPYLPHKFGNKSIKLLAFDLNKQINQRFEPSMPIDILGFSMGGLIAVSYTHLRAHET